MLVEYLRRLFAEDRPALVLLGDPRHESGDASAGSALVRRLGAFLESVFGVSVDYWDEFGTTTDAIERLAEGPRGVRRDPARRDRLAAQALLQSYLDARGWTRADAGGAGREDEA